MPEPSAPAPAIAQVRRYACPGCGATLVFAAGIEKLRCEYCDREQEIPHEDGPTATGPVEHALQELLSDTANKGWGTETVSFSCKECGANVTLPPGQTTGRCPFCDNNVVVQRPVDPNLIRPETLIPFKIDKKAAAAQFRSWLGALWFRPSNLQRMADLAEIKGLYTPYWTFDAQASSRWSAESGFYYYITETYTDSDGNTQTREVQMTRWEPSWGEHSYNYVDVLVCASSLSESLVRGIEPFNTQQELVAYQPEYLSGWMAEEYKVGPQEGWQRGQGSMMQYEYQACDGQVPGDVHRNLNVSTRLDNVTWKHVLLPIWIAAYRYNGRVYHFMVNGETGKVSGEAPLSWPKVIAFVALIIALACAIYYFVRKPSVEPARHRRYGAVMRSIQQQPKHVLGLRQIRSDRVRATVA